jgi:hypothetical protein
MADELLNRDGLPQFLSEYVFEDTYRIPLMAKAPTLDGFVDEEEWRCAAGFDGLAHAAMLEERGARAYIGATKTHIYFAIVSETPPEGSIAAEVTTHTTSIIWDDSVEIWVNAHPEAETGITYQMLANSIGYDTYECHVVGNVPQNEWYGWNGHYKMATSRSKFRSKPSAKAGSRPTASGASTSAGIGSSPGRSRTSETGPTTPRAK